MGHFVAMATIGHLVTLGCFAIMGHFKDISVGNIYCHHIGVIVATILENMDFYVIEAITSSYRHTISMKSCAQKPKFDRESFVKNKVWSRKFCKKQSLVSKIL